MLIFQVPVGKGSGIYFYVFLDGESEFRGQKFQIAKEMVQKCNSLVEKSKIFKWRIE